MRPEINENDLLRTLYLGMFSRLFDSLVWMTGYSECSNQRASSVVSCLGLVGNWFPKISEKPNVLCTNQAL